MELAPDDYGIIEPAELARWEAMVARFKACNRRHNIVDGHCTECGAIETRVVIQVPTSVATAVDRKAAFVAWAEEQSKRRLALQILPPR